MRVAFAESRQSDRSLPTNKISLGDLVKRFKDDPRLMQSLAFQRVHADLDSTLWDPDKLYLASLRHVPTDDVSEKVRLGAFVVSLCRLSLRPDVAPVLYQGHSDSSRFVLSSGFKENALAHFVYFVPVREPMSEELSAYFHEREMRMRT
ncbi:MAG: hypothetical protein AABX38_03440 [Candidatus Micrarchaeota archaeon]